MSGGETKCTSAKRLTTALELPNTHPTSDAVVLAATQNHLVNAFMEEGMKVIILIQGSFSCAQVTRLGFIWVPFLQSDYEFCTSSTRYTGH